MGEDGYDRLSRRRSEVEDLTRSLAEWSAAQPDIRALGLIGSWARDEAMPSSDVDVLLLTSQPDRYTAADDWLDLLERPPVVRREQFGVLAERRVRLPSGLEVEFGIGPASWAATGPVDDGTRTVVLDGLRILHDPDELLAKLQAAVLNATGFDPPSC